MTPLRAEVMSAIAAVASALTAFFAYRTSLKAMSINVAPLLIGEYKFDDEFILFKNVGKGPALNIELQKTNRHYLDLGIIVSYEFDEGSPLSILADKDAEIAFKIKGAKNISSDHRKVNNYSIKEVGEQKEIGIIYSDIYRKKWITKLKFSLDKKIGGWAITTTGIRRYYFYYWLWDRLDSFRFNSLKKYRELIFTRKATK